MKRLPRLPCDWLPTVSTRNILGSALYNGAKSSKQNAVLSAILLKVIDPSSYRDRDIRLFK
jgi:hypothetical protein